MGTRDIGIAAFGLGALACILAAVFARSNSQRRGTVRFWLLIAFLQAASAFEVPYKLRFVLKREIRDRLLQASPLSKEAAQTTGIVLLFLAALAGLALAYRQITRRGWCVFLASVGAGLPFVTFILEMTASDALENILYQPVGSASPIALLWAAGGLSVIAAAAGSIAAR